MDGLHSKFTLTTKVKYVIGATLLSSTFIFYIYGISAPVFRITGGGPGPFESQSGYQDFTLPRLLHLLLEQRDYVPFVCIFVFSFFLPLLKFALITGTLVSSACCRRRPLSVSLPLKIAVVLRVVAKYQLVDVFSTTILVSFINFVGVSAEPLFAAQAYQAYCLFSIITIQWLCHCYSDMLDRRKMADCCWRVQAALRNPLLPRFIPMRIRMLEGTIDERATPLDFAEDSGGLLTPGLPMVPPLASTEGTQRTRLHWCSQCVRQRNSSHVYSLSRCNTYWESVNRSIEFSSYANPAGLHCASGGAKHVPLGGSCDVCTIFERDVSLAARGPDLPASLLTFPHDLCGRGGHFVNCYPHALFRIPEAAAPDEPAHISRDAFLGPTQSRCCFSGCLLRMFFLSCSFCISALAALICWVRPILQVALVPGKLRGFAIETCEMSLGDVFWRLYSMGHMWSGCTIIAVFTVLATLMLYVACMCTLASASVVYWTTRSSNQLQVSTVPGNVSQRSHSGPINIAEKAMRMTKAFSDVSVFLGDIAMPDVQSIGLLACYCIANNIDFLGARLPGAPIGSPNGTLEKLLWNFSGFWAMVALGVSASQVHRLSVSFDDVRQDMGPLFHTKDNNDFPNIFFTRSRPNPGSPHPLLRNSGRGGIRELILEDAPAARPPELSALTENSNFFNWTLRRRRHRSCSFGLILHGCIRMVVSVALLLPIWLKPADIVDVDLGLVNKHLEGFTEYVNPLLKQVLPQSLGDCASATHVAPRPCVGAMPLAYIRTDIYEATARWATGLKTTELHTARFEVTPKGRITFTITGKINSLSLSLRIGGCFYGEDHGKCPVLWDGTDGCCGDDITFMLEMSARCSSSFPYLADANFLRTHISRLVVKEKVLGIFSMELTDITQIVEDQLSEWARTYLDPKNKWIQWKNGTALSVINLLNVLLDINAPAGIICPRAQ